MSSWTIDHSGGMMLRGKECLLYFDHEVEDSVLHGWDANIIRQLRTVQLVEEIQIRTDRLDFIVERPPDEEVGLEAAIGTTTRYDGSGPTET